MYDCKSSCVSLVTRISTLYPPKLSWKSLDNVKYIYIVKSKPFLVSLHLPIDVFLAPGPCPRTLEKAPAVAPSSRCCAAKASCRRSFWTKSSLFFTCSWPPQRAAPRLHFVHRERLTTNNVPQKKAGKQKPTRFKMICVFLVLKYLSKYIYIHTYTYTYIIYVCNFSI